MTELTMAEFVGLAQRGRFFTVRFVKRGNQEERTMHCRTGVKKGTKGGSLGYKPSEHHLLSVYDVAAEGFRMVNLEEPLSAKIAGMKLTWDRRKGRWVSK